MCNARPALKDVFAHARHQAERQEEGERQRLEHAHVHFDPAPAELNAADDGRASRCEQDGYERTHPLEQEPRAEAGAEPRKSGLQPEGSTMDA